MDRGSNDCDNVLTRYAEDTLNPVKDPWGFLDPTLRTTGLGNVIGLSVGLYGICRLNMNKCDYVCIIQLRLLKVLNQHVFGLDRKIYSFFT